MCSFNTLTYRQTDGQTYLNYIVGTLLEIIYAENPHLLYWEHEF